MRGDFAGPAQLRAEPPPLVVFIAAVLACATGDAVSCWAGRKYGPRALQRVRVPIALDQVAFSIERWSAWVLVFGKFLPGFSLVVSPLAGATRFPWPRFFLLTFSGSSLWSALAVGAGVYFSAEVRGLLDAVERLGSFALVGVMLFVAAYMAFKRAERRRLQGESFSSNQDAEVRSARKPVKSAK